MVLGHRGDLTLVDKFPGPGKFVTYDYDTSGYVANVVAGQVIELDTRPNWHQAGSARLAWLREKFRRYSLKSPWRLVRAFLRSSISPHLLSVLADAVCRLGDRRGYTTPVCARQLPKLFNYSNTTTLYGGQPVAIVDQFRFSEATFFTNVELGVNFLSGSWSFGAAYYHDWSGDTSTNGGKLGIAYKF